jgi:Txe/YoeB family toxin of Txe-Axe toxin-antitoxin module
MSKKKAKAAPSASQETVSRAPWRIHFFKRHVEDEHAQSIPARDFLDACPIAVAAKIIAVLKAVADAPPPAFSGGGKWEAMHGEMNGFYEVRIDGPKRHHYRLFCVLERAGAKVGLGGPSLVLITGKDKPFRSVLSAADYAEVRRLGQEFQARTPRSIEP